MSAVKYWIWLSELKGIGALKARRLLELFDNPETVYYAVEDDYVRAGVASGDIEKLMDKDMKRTRAIIDRCRAEGWTTVTLGDALYPKRLREIHDPPVVLYVRGRLPSIDEEAAVAVVGTRSCTPYGAKIAERIGFEVARRGGLLVTGLAKGIDSAAARGALRAGGRVVGVLGCGLDIVYPAGNEKLMTDAASSGAVISEYPPGTPAAGGNFPRRNRIISGLTLGCVIVEAPERSGALITAARALEQGRDVFVVPGNVDSDTFRGSNRLLREGAIPVMSGGDVMDEYADRFPGKGAEREGADIMPVESEPTVKKEDVSRRIRQKETKKVIDKSEGQEYIDSVKNPPADLSPEELAVWSTMNGGKRHADEIVASSGLGAGRVLGILTMLEIKGRVRRLAGKYFEQKDK